MMNSMRIFVLAALLPSVRAFAGAVGAADAHAAAATGFPGAYVETLKSALRVDPLYATRLLDAFQSHLQAVAGMTGRRAVADYLEAAADMDTLDVALGREAILAPRAAALLLADALARPGQFRELLAGLETLQHGLGRHPAAMLLGARGAGDKKLIEALRAAGEAHADSKRPAYGLSRRFERLFDAVAEAPPPRVRAPAPPAQP